MDSMGLSLLTTLLELEDEERTLQKELENMPINKKLDLILSKKILKKLQKKKALLKKQNMLETNIGVELLTRIAYLNGIKNNTNTIYNNNIEILHEIFSHVVIKCSFNYLCKDCRTRRAKLCQ